MASSFKFNAIVVLIIFISFNSFAVNCKVFEVGDDGGWAVPDPKNADHFNDWASNNRFKVNDTLHFKYDKDSVLEVSQENYEKCRASKPIFFSNNGDTAIVLDRLDLFYFISGVGGHCQRGLKMVIKVLASDDPSQSSSSSAANQTSSPPPSHAPALRGSLSFQAIIMVFSMLAFGATFMY